MTIRAVLVAGANAVASCASAVVVATMAKTGPTCNEASSTTHPVEGSTQYN